MGPSNPSGTAKDLCAETRTDTSGSGAGSDSAVWLKVQKKFGPVSFHRIGITFRNSKICFLLDAGFAASALDVELDGLALCFPLSKPTDFSVELHGLDIAFSSGPVGISGGLLKTTNESGDVVYNGEAMIKMEALSIAALGSYAKLQGGQSSLFIYAMLSYPLGGPPCFFVTGLAAGFGYNRSLKIPALKDLKSFPLVAAAANTGSLTCSTTPADALTTMSDYIPISIGEDWLAAGVKFTSFEMIRSFALLSVSFGSVFEIALLGLSTIDVPAACPNPIAHAELALEAIFAPEKGLLSVEAALTPESYILDKSCTLTGGFAFYLWFGGEHSGDFGISLGGYHPSFVKPAHYPSVDRLGFNWKPTDKITIKGEAYFALTPSCIMAGGRLDAVYENGNLKAWFIAYADFLISWKPFHYDISIGASLGASYRVHCFLCHHTFSIELSARLHLYGPDFSGEVHIHWFIISFTISFGNAGSAEPAPLNWDEFSRSFLPQPERKQTANLRMMVADAPPQPMVCDIKVSNGLVKEIKTDGQPPKWVINAQNLCIVTHSVIPSTKITFNENPINIVPPKLGIKPMGVGFKLDSSHIVSLRRKKDDNSYESETLQFETVLENVPESLWSPDKLSGPRANTIGSVPVGLKLTPVPLQYDSLPQNGTYDIQTLTGQEDVKDTKYSWGNRAPAVPIYPQEDAVKKVKDTIQDDGISANRSCMLDALNQLGFTVLTGIQICTNAYHTNAENLFLAPPVLLNLGAQIKS
jgi:hypothetical protein